MITRRILALAALSGLAAGAIFPVAAQAQARQIGAVKVDASRLVDQGWGTQAPAIGAAMEQELITQLGPMFRRGSGNTLLVTLRGVWLASYAGGGGGGKPTSGGASNDNLDSVATVLDRQGREIASWPILSTELSSSGGAWYLPDIDRRRVQALIRNNALWIKRYLGA